MQKIATVIDWIGRYIITLMISYEGNFWIDVDLDHMVTKIDGRYVSRATMLNLLFNIERDSKGDDDFLLSVIKFKRDNIREEDPFMALELYFGLLQHYYKKYNTE